MTGIRVELERRDDDGRIATVTVDNPGKLNILDPDAIAALERAFNGLATEGTLRAVVLRGAGNRAFIGGADIRAMATLEPESARAFITSLHRACDAVRALPVPVIARIEGYVLGAGLEIAASCDVRIAAEDSQFGMPEVKVGIPSVIEAALLPRLIGWGRTRWLLYTGDMIDAEDAGRWGLVERVVKSADLDKAVEACLSAILAAGPRAIRLQKALMRDWEVLSLSQAIDRGIDAFAQAYGHRSRGSGWLRFWVSARAKADDLDYKLLLARDLPCQQRGEPDQQCQRDPALHPAPEADTIIVRGLAIDERLAARGKMPTAPLAIAWRPPVCPIHASPPVRKAAAWRLCRAGGDGRSSGWDPRSSRSTARPSRPCGRSRTAR